MAAQAVEQSQELQAEKLRLELETLRLEHQAQRASIAWKWLVSVGAILVLLALVAVVVTAAMSRGIVIERFEAPSVADAAALSEEDLSEALLHRLTWLRANTDVTNWSTAHVGAPSASWLDDVRVEIPNTGIAVGDLHRTLRRWLGRDSYVRVRLSPGGPKSCPFYALAWEAGRTRGPICGRPGRELSDAAEAVYRQVHPYLYAVYLSPIEGRLSDANTLLRDLAFNSAHQVERAMALNALAANLLEFEGRCEEVLPLLRMAASLRGTSANVWGNISNARNCTGDEGGAAEATQREIVALNSSRHELSRRDAQRRLREARALLAGQHGDYAERLRIALEMEQLGLGAQSAVQARALADLHDIGRAYPYLASPSHASISDTQRAWLGFQISWELERWRRAADFLAALTELYRRWGPYTERQTITHVEPLRAIALARAGNPRAAEEVVGRFPAGCYLCARSRAIVAEALGTRAEADRWFAEAIRLAPALPDAYAERGQVLLARRETQAARRSLDEAVRRGPRWADALKLRGDALAGLGDLGGALRDYEAAAAVAPRWLELRINLGLTLWRAGRPTEARNQFSRAAGLPGRASDRHRLRRILADLEG